MILCEVTRKNLHKELHKVTQIYTKGPKEHIFLLIQKFTQNYVK